MNLGVGAFRLLVLGDFFGLAEGSAVSKALSNPPADEDEEVCLGRCLGSLLSLFIFELAMLGLTAAMGLAAIGLEGRLIFGGSNLGVDAVFG